MNASIGRTAILYSSIALAMAPSARVQTAADSAGAAVAAFHAALAAGDSVRALALLADDVTILESGGRETLAEYRAHHLSGDIRFAGAVPSNRGVPQVTVIGNVAWVVGTSERVGTIEGRAINSAGAELVVVAREATGWRIRAIHWSSRRRPPAG